MSQLQRQEIKTGVRQVDVYAGLNVMILLLELHRYAQSKDDLKNEIAFYPCGRVETKNHQPIQLSRIIGYSYFIGGDGFRKTVGSFLESANLRCANFAGEDLIGANFHNADFSGITYEDGSIMMTNLSGACLVQVDFSGADLRYASLDGSNLYCANLSEANLSNAHLDGAYLMGADLSHTDLTETDLSRANFRNANLSSADLTGADLENISWNEGTKWRASKD